MKERKSNEWGEIEKGRVKYPGRKKDCNNDDYVDIDDNKLTQIHTSQLKANGKWAKPKKCDEENGISFSHR